MMRLLVVVASLALAGCRLGFDDAALDAGPDASTTPPADFASGTRIRAIVNDGPGAPGLERVAWFDTTVGEECAIVTAEDGQQRCLPSRVGAGVQYSDAACTIPLLIFYQPLDVASCPSAAALGRVDLHDGRNRVVQVGANYPGTVYQSTQPGSCVMVQNAGEFYVTGATVAPDQFVAFTEQIQPAGPLGYIELASTDGARQLDSDHLVEMSTGERCSIETTTWNEAVCLPARTLGFLAFADPGCTEAALIAFDHLPNPTVHVPNTTVCADSHSDVTPGDPLPVWYQRQGAACTMQLATPPFTAWRIADIQPARVLATATLDTGSAGSVVMARWQLSTGHSVPAGTFDRRNHDFCYPISLKDTFQTVCAPLWSGSGVAMFSDAACTVATGEWASCRGAWRSTWFPTAPFQPTCAGIGYFVRREDVLVPGPLYASQSGNCVPIDPSVTVYKQSSTNYADSEMVPFTRRTE